MDDGRGEGCRESEGDGGHEEESLHPPFFKHTYTPQSQHPSISSGASVCLSAPLPRRDPSDIQGERVRPRGRWTFGSMSSSDRRKAEASRLFPSRGLILSASLPVSSTWQEIGRGPEQVWLMLQLDRYFCRWPSAIVFPGFWLFLTPPPFFH